MNESVAAKLREVTKIVQMTPDLPVPPIPEPPKRTGKANTNVRTKMAAIQAYMNALEYNYTGKLYFDVSKNRSHKSIYGTAKDIIHDALPIQCLEAVFVAAYLTAGGPEYEGATFNHQIDRIPISFKTLSGGTIFRHIVLAIKYQHLWGALGLSRSPGLMNKDLKFKSLSELVCNYIENYNAVRHDVVKIYVGFPFSHDIHSTERVEWRVLNIKTNIHPWDDVAAQLDLWEYSELMSHLHRVGELPEYFADKFFLHKPPKRSQSPSRRPLRSSFECESFASVDVAPDAAVVSKLPDLLLRVTPEVLHFKQAPLAASPSADENNRPPLRPNDLVEFASANLFLNNVSLVHHLVVYVIVGHPAAQGVRLPPQAGFDDVDGDPPYPPGCCCR
ncbi:hypothetical protein, variant [Aphanomyces invadans]|uniref:Vasohibin n=1 Tax=Aphanomyces invadans TaxID=157072 RepID=A0A024UJS5_9STRA|nr:hypothetical protein, variant [Aphanomyces invadans]ETW06706.1 hypothetical protein, variant [Aphanomyces invadans]|eukprot:XP_008864781.1 hypothetical protein, variant [Aphanomyces invadans]